ncbi:MAG: DUF5333 domain-containing protein [Roseinatronobacter sp.]|nr:DUF5333 domain-containing protein [Roseinatronobacter sp.]
MIMRKNTKFAAMILGAALALAAPASASAAQSQAEINDALRNTPAIYNGLFTAALIKHVVDTCPAVSPPGRFARVNYFLSLYNRARGLGYSRAQIEAFVDDKAEQERLRGIVLSHLRRAGVDPASEAEVCAFARTQSAERTALGRQLRER